MNANVSRNQTQCRGLYPRGDSNCTDDHAFMIHCSRGTPRRRTADKLYTRSHIAHACGVRVHVNMSDPNLSSLFAEGQFADSPIGIHKTGIYALWREIISSLNGHPLVLQRYSSLLLTRYI
ncbi:hypothetical protein PISMIDRAFT_622992 [Pisolithus microcarpus 441]|uniref:Uncharacterized protein n=1 Tax=Pisolithus microcarpus 441 TaxID=765257 RepID=A0A0C9Y4F5_9AGAM|nr:hypothetical protein PISMIDRAFT_622992 [Pisolithus microcarpus 441]